MLKSHQDIIISNFSLLVTETDLDSLVPELLSRNVFNKRMINRILDPSHSAKRQKTDLYVEMLKRGPHAFDKLLDALISTNQRNLADTLKAMDTQNSSEIHRSSSLNSVISNRSPYSSDNGNESDGPCHSIFRKNSAPVGGIERTDSFGHSLPSNSVHYQSRYSRKESSSNLSDLLDFQKLNVREPQDKVFNPPVYELEAFDEGLRLSGFLSPEDKVIYTCKKNLPVIVKCATQWQSQGVNMPRIYKMDSYPRGYALLVNNSKFWDTQEFPDRSGSENDVSRFKELLKQLHFEVVFHENKTRREMELIVEDFTKTPNLDAVDCVWVTFMSHGQEGESCEDSEIIGVDGIGYKTEDIISRFYNDSCRALIEKPKLFFFQACRGNLTDPGVILQSVNLSFSNRITTDGKKIQVPIRNLKVRTQSDIFIAYPAPAGMMANRDRLTGAWFIQTVVDVFSEFAWNTHLEDLLKLVDERIKNVNNLLPLNFQTVTTKTIGWNKHLYFNPGLYRDRTTRTTVRIDNSQTSSKTDEGMDVVDATTSSQEKSPNGKPYEKLNTYKDEDSDDQSGKYDCFNFPSCKTS